MLVNAHSWERALGQTLPWLPLQREWVQVLGYKIKLLHDWAPIDHFSSIFQHLLLPLPHTLPLPPPICTPFTLSHTYPLSLFPPSHPHASLSPPLSCWPYSFSSFLFGIRFLLSLLRHFSSFCFSNSCCQSLPLKLSLPPLDRAISPFSCSRHFGKNVTAIV